MVGGLVVAGAARRLLSSLGCLVLAAFLVIVREGAAQVAACDSLLIQPVRVPNGYRPQGPQGREDRCEGVFARPVAGTAFALASFTQRDPKVDLRITREWVLSWGAPDSANVWVRARSLRRRLYYRMDTRLNAGAGNFTWRTDFLSALRLTRDEVGVVAWTKRRMGGTNATVFLPAHVRPSTSEDSGSISAYQVVLVPGLELSQVFVTLVALDSAGAFRRVIQPTREVGIGYYPADRPVSIIVSRPREPGFYRFDVSARLPGGSASVEQIVFFQPGP